MKIRCAVACPRPTGILLPRGYFPPHGRLTRGRFCRIDADNMRAEGPGALPAKGNALVAKGDPHPTILSPLCLSAQRANRSPAARLREGTIWPVEPAKENGEATPLPGPTRCAGAPPWLEEATGCQPARIVLASVSATLNHCATIVELGCHKLPAPRFSVAGTGQKYFLFRAESHADV